MSGPEPRWVPRLVIEAVHLDQVREHGGLIGLRDENALESALRLGEPPVIARIRDDALILDARTIDDWDIPEVAGCVARALSASSDG